MRALLKQNRKLFLYLITANLLLAFGQRIWEAVFNNFAVESIGVGPEAIGWIQSAREVPGLLAIGVAFLALVLSEFRIMAFSVILLGTGIVLTGMATTVPMLIVATMVMSFGFHFFGPGSSSVLLMSVSKEDAPKALGALQSISASAAVAATVSVYLLATRIGYRPLFLAVGLLVIVGGLVLLPMGRSGSVLPARRRIRLRRRYWVFYTLAFLMGSRRHIFTTFAPFLLVRDFGVAVQVMAVLYLANGLINTYAYQFVGKLVARFGERTVLTLAFIALVPVFLGYAYVALLPLLYALFVIDNVLFGVNLALTTYLQKMAVSPEEITANLSAQQTINHISAVIVPVVGGTVWAVFGSEAPFLFGVGIAVASLIIAQFVRPGRPTGGVPSPGDA